MWRQKYRLSKMLTPCTYLSVPVIYHLNILRFRTTNRYRQKRWNQHAVTVASCEVLKKSAKILKYGNTETTVPTFYKVMSLKNTEILLLFYEILCCWCIVEENSVPWLDLFRANLKNVRNMACEGLKMAQWRSMGAVCRCLIDLTELFFLLLSYTLHLMLH